MARVGHFPSLKHLDETSPARVFLKAKGEMLKIKVMVIAAAASGFVGIGSAARAHTGAPDQGFAPLMEGRSVAHHVYRHARRHARTGNVLASWYGGGERLSSHTASGERFRAGGLTVAHRSLPIGTRLRITHNGHSAVCRVNDRGPAAWTGRSIDLSRGCAQAVGMHGVAHVHIAVI